MRSRTQLSGRLTNGRDLTPRADQDQRRAPRASALFSFWRWLRPHRHRWLRQASIDLADPGSGAIIAVRYCPRCELVEVIE